MMLLFWRRKPWRLWCPVLNCYITKTSSRDESVTIGFMHVVQCPVSHEVNHV